MSLVVFLSGESQGDALGGIGRSYQAHFNALGYEFLEIKLTDKNDAAATLGQVLQSRKPKFILSFMAVGLTTTVAPRPGTIENLWEAADIPFLTVFGDSPAYFFDRHIVPGMNFASIYGFPDHLELRKTLPAQKGFACTVPPLLVDMLQHKDIDFRKKREGKLVFLKNGNDPARLVTIWRETLPPAVLQPLQDMASQLAHNLNDATVRQIDNTITAYFADKDMDITQLVKLRLFFNAQLDDYIRRVKATYIVRSLLDFPIEIHGANWNHIDFSNARARWVNTCDFEASRQLILESLGCLDVSPNTGLAAHDRVLRAFGRYTMCLTNEQRFFKQAVPQHKDMMFRFERNSLQGKVADMLGRPAHYVELGQDIAETFRRTYPPEASLGRLVEIAELIRMNRLPALPSAYPEYFVWPPEGLSSG